MLELEILRKCVESSNQITMMTRLIKPYCQLGIMVHDNLCSKGCKRRKCIFYNMTNKSMTVGVYD